jgi:hypothetical protein
MTRTLLFATLCLGIPAFAAGDREKAHDDMIDAQKDINQGKRKAANDEVKAQRELTGNKEMTSMNAELRNQLGDDWSVKKSGAGYLATRLEHKKAAKSDFTKLNDQMRDFRDKYKDAQATRRGGEVMLRGRIDDCEDAAKAAEEFADNDCVDKIFVDISCSNR